MSFAKHTLPGGLGINATHAFSVVDPPGFKQPEVAPPTAPAAPAAPDAKGGGARASGARAKKGTEATMAGGVKIGGEFTPQKNPDWLQHRMDVWDRVAAKHAATIAAKEKKPITITLPDGSQKEGTAWETSPMDIANGISSGLARTVVVARVKYAVALADEGIVKADGIDEDSPATDEEQDAVLWDATRPLEGDCALELLKYSDKEGKTVFWHSSAHMLGQALEHEFGGKLTHGPALDNGFFYDCYLGDVSIGDKDWKALEKLAADTRGWQKLVDKLKASKSAPTKAAAPTRSSKRTSPQPHLTPLKRKTRDRIRAQQFAKTANATVWRCIHRP